MNIYYANLQFIKLPTELQNHVCSYLPPHPIHIILNDSEAFASELYRRRNLSNSVSIFIKRRMFCLVCWKKISIYNSRIQQCNSERCQECDVSEIEDDEFNS